MSPLVSSLRALVAAKKLTACQRHLFELGAGRVVGLPARFVFVRNGHSTFDHLRSRLAGARIFVGSPLADGIFLL